jgi:hypothetical protein
MKYLFAFVMMTVGVACFAQTWRTDYSTTSLGTQRFESGGGGLNYGISTAAGAGWGWRFTDNSNVPYFIVDYPNANTTINNPTTTFNTYTLLKLVGSDYSNGHGLEFTFYGNNNITTDMSWSYGGGPGSAAIVNFQNKPLTFGTNNIGRMIIMANGNVGIGTFDPGSYKLAVEGKIGAREINITTAAWSDYVFDKDYNLPSLEEVERYIRNNHHLSEIPSAQEVERDGIDVGKMNQILVKKIEELTLYVIEQNKVIKQQEERLTKLEANKH